jgi:hypothetical protein
MYIYAVSGIFFRVQTGTRLPYKAIVSSPTEEEAIQYAIAKVEATLGMAQHYSARAVVLGVTGDSKSTVHFYGIDLPRIEQLFSTP